MEVLSFVEYDDKKAAEIELFIKNNFKIVRINKDASRLSAKIVRDRKRLTGKKLKLTDAIIAATAINKGLGLLTNDREDFTHIEGLNLL